MPSLDKIPNKLKRQEQHLKAKRQKESAKRDDRLRRRRTEDKNPKLREERRAKNVPHTIDRKRTWDEVNADDEAAGRIGLSFDVLNPKRQKIIEGVPPTSEDAVADALAAKQNEKERKRKSRGKHEGEDAGEDESESEEVDSMLGSDTDEDEDLEAGDANSGRGSPDPAPSEAPSAATAGTAATAATDLNLTPEALTQKFPALFKGLEREPKVLVTTSINATIHHEAAILCDLFPNSQYIRRTAHFHSYKYSVREIAKYAAARDFTTMVILNEEYKKPKGIDIVHLPEGPMFHFSISNWVEGKRLPGHGNPTNHFPELILNGFKTPLGLLTAHLFRSLYPPHPEIQGRQVVTMHNQRDYIFFRRHRYVFRDKRGTEKSIQGADGKPVKGVESIRAGLQELGPRFTLKLRRVDKGIQRASGQEWEWQAGDEKVRTRFSL